MIAVCLRALGTLLLSLGEDGATGLREGTSMVRAANCGLAIDLRSPADRFVNLDEFRSLRLVPSVGIWADEECVSRGLVDSAWVSRAALLAQMRSIYVERE